MWSTFDTSNTMRSNWGIRLTRVRSRAADVDEVIRPLARTIVVPDKLTFDSSLAREMRITGLAAMTNLLSVEGTPGNTLDSRSPAQFVQRPAQNNRRTAVQSLSR